MSYGQDRSRRLVDAVCASVAYADIFDYALEDHELHRDLVFVCCDYLEAASATEQAILAGRLTRTGDFVTLADRSNLAALRLRRQRQLNHLWNIARSYGRLLAAIPFVRMVGVTGSLAANNPVEDADVDYILVSVPGRLWLARAGAVAIVRLARRRNAVICPNYLLSIRSLALADHNLYTAHELMQLVPLAGWDVYRDLLAANGWRRQFLPNRQHAGGSVVAVPRLARVLQRAGEATLTGPAGSFLNALERERKAPRFRGFDSGAFFDDDVCEGHFHRHRDSVLKEFAERTARLGIDVSDFAETSIANGASQNLVWRT